MSVVLPRAPADPLAPVREALVSRARADVDALLAAADLEVESTLAAARSEAEAIRAEARALGEADAAAVLVTGRARARRQARALVLEAQQQSYAELHARVVEQARALRADPAYRAWRDGLRERVRRSLGNGAVVSEHPDGGVAGEVPGRRLEHTLDDLAEQALDELGPDVAGLWAP